MQNETYQCINGCNALYCVWYSLKKFSVCSNKYNRTKKYEVDLICEKNKKMRKFSLFYLIRKNAFAKEMIIIKIIIKNIKKQTKKKRKCGKCMPTTLHMRDTAPFSRLQ